MHCDNGAVPGRERSKLHSSSSMHKDKQPAISRKAAGAALFRHVLADCLAQVVPNAAEVAAGREQEDNLHQLRIGLRRLRTALRELGPLGPELDPSHEAALTAAFRALGARRDAMVLAGTILPRLAAAGAPDLEWPAAPAPRSAAEAVNAPEFRAALLRLAALVQEPEGEAPACGSEALHKFVVRRLRSLHRRVLREALAFDALEPALQHRVRKRLKRLRYLAEFAAPLFGARRVRRYLKALRPAQEALGRHNDELMALRVFDSAAPHDARAWFAVGWLQAQQAASARAGAKALRQLLKAPRFWDRRRR